MAVRLSGSVAALSKALSPEFFVVHRPDIPYLLAGPDVLASRTGETLAVFVPTKLELANPSRLRARLLLSRFVLPAKTATVLVLPEVGRHELDDETLSGFSRSIDQRNISRRSFGAGPLETTKPVSTIVRGWVLERASFLTALTREPDAAGKLLRVTRRFDLLAREMVQSSAPDSLRADSPFGAPIEVSGRAYLASASWKGSLRSLVAPYSAAIVSICFWTRGETVEVGVPVLGAIYLRDRSARVLSSRESRGAALAGWALLDDRLARDQAADILNTWLERSL